MFRFADIEMLRYRLDGFAELSLRRKLLIYWLAEAALWGRDITTDQNGRYNLRIRRMLEAVYLLGSDATPDWDTFRTYLYRVWFASGIHHHYGSDKFAPEFSEAWLRDRAVAAGVSRTELDELCPVIFDPAVCPKRVNTTAGEDLLLTSSCNYYDGVNQAEAQDYYALMSAGAGDRAPSFGLNSTLVKRDGRLHEDVWREGGRYGQYISHIIDCLSHAADYAESDKQREVIALLIDYYRTGDLTTFDRYSIAWLQDTDGKVDFINGFIETYGDPLGFKASWEGLVEYEDAEATRRCQKVSQWAQWFEDHSPVDPRFRKPKVKGVSARGICAAMLGGDEYPATAIGINLPNADWIRAEYGSKSVTIANITRAYDEAAKESGMKEEFVIDNDTLKLVYKYGPLSDDLHTDLHECLGHGSGQLLPGIDPGALGSYASTIEEARADLFGLYYMADEKMIELGLLPDATAYRAHYYTYMMNGLLTQLVRIEPGAKIEEAHMRNRSLIARWVYDNHKDVVDIIRKADGKAYVEVRDYPALRRLFGELLAEVQRIKSEGDYEAAKDLVERYGITPLPYHEEIYHRYKQLGIAPYKGFINPRLHIVQDEDGRPTSVTVDYSEAYDEQMLRYSKQYSDD